MRHLYGGGLDVGVDLPPWVPEQEREPPLHPPLGLGRSEFSPSGRVFSLGFRADDPLDGQRLEVVEPPRRVESPVGRDRLRRPLRHRPLGLVEGRFEAEVKPGREGGLPRADADDVMALAHRPPFTAPALDRVEGSRSLSRGAFGCRTRRRR